MVQELKSGKSRFTWQGAGPKVITLTTKKAINDGIYVLNGVIHDGEERRDISAAPALLGEHNWQNAAAAYAVARALDIPAGQIQQAMESFPGLAHRMQLVATIGAVKFVNDSKATNAEATENALRAYENIYWILGGKAKEGGIESLTEYFPKITQAYLIGDAANEFAEVLKANNVAYQHCGTLENATKAAAKETKEAGGGVVLLSPACASFDQFRSFEHRGDVFAEVVRELATHSPIEVGDAQNHT
jgi:UDP-N-acetylmuramoylalanine--D-glutamate ligase